MKNTIIYLIGFAGAGKYNVAKALAEKAKITVIDNQLINNSIFVAVGADGVKPLHLGVWREIAKIREAVLNAVTYISEPEENFVFTNQLLDRDKIDEKYFKEIEYTALARQATFVPVRLTCEPTELLKRVVNEDRRIRLKLVSAEHLSNMLETHEILKVDHPNLLELDITNVAPQDAASKILNHIENI